MSLDDVISELRRRGHGLIVVDGTLRHIGPPLADDDPMRTGIEAHRTLLTELFTFAPGGRCEEAACYRLRVPGGAHCPDHRQPRDAMTEPRPARVP